MAPLKRDAPPILAAPVGEPVGHYSSSPTAEDDPSSSPTAEDDPSSKKLFGFSFTDRDLLIWLVGLGVWGAVTFVPMIFATPSCDAEWQGTLWYGQDTQQIMAAARIYGLCFLFETCSFCFYLCRYKSWTRENKSDDVGKDDKLYHKRLLYSLKAYVYGLYLHGIWVQAMYIVLLGCHASATWYLMLSLIPSLVMHAFATAHLSWMMVLKLQVIRSEYGNNATRLFCIAVSSWITTQTFFIIQIMLSAFPSLVESSAASLVQFLIYYVFRGTTVLCAVYYTHVMASLLREYSKNEVLQKRHEAQWLLVSAIFQAVSGATSVISMISWLSFGNGHISYTMFSWALLVDTITNMFACFVLAGIVGQSKFLGAFRAAEVLAGRRTVENLAKRSMTVYQLLSFCTTDLRVRMPKFDPMKTTTRDVVRSVIIPKTREVSGGACSFATAYGTIEFPWKMVTHAWDNLFSDLIAAVVADALGEDTYAEIATKLATLEGTMALMQEVTEKEVDNRSYWICAFCVDQHVSICHNPPAQGTLSDTAPERAYKVCTCNKEKYKNGHPKCEMDKFDQMMSLLKESEETKGHFMQVIAVDRQFDLFRRAWCLAEISEANLSHIPPRLMLSGESIVTKDKSDKIERLDVRRCKAYRKEDKLYVLSRIQEYTSIDAFNAKLRALLGGMVLTTLAHQQRLVAKYEESERNNIETIRLKQERIEQLQRRNEELEEDLKSCKEQLAGKTKAEQSKWWFQL
jgi:hypothetical protein